MVPVQVPPVPGNVPPRYAKGVVSVELMEDADRPPWFFTWRVVEAVAVFTCVPKA